MQFWNDCNTYEYFKNLSLASGDVVKECTNEIWKKTLYRSIYDFRWFAKDEEIAKTFKAVVKMTKIL